MRTAAAMERICPASQATRHRQNAAFFVYYALLRGAAPVDHFREPDLYWFENSGTKTGMFAKHSGHMRLITFLIPLFLVLGGTRVPDISRPHKPKPLRRAVLDKNPTRSVLKTVVKFDSDPVVPHRSALDFHPAEVYLSEALPIRSVSLPLPSLNQTAPRAPPAPVSPA
ncbi:hypothetical protein [Geobacter sp. SVR]|uniref:hypothetical protein n=1 Tax=Geobacter sp. SVR TaxID=2495594 RepID=UPI00143EF655|nr:hypothetical protein [Geobacter sp. SVR]BCS52520.1 hypothetical protein GSVR_08280 [Geobacter sp. SVR]GCF84043.1 hypothetical protein GSbR_06430 [Geobacter sp. SVR]